MASSVLNKISYHFIHALIFLLLFINFLLFSFSSSHMFGRVLWDCLSAFLNSFHSKIIKVILIRRRRAI